MAQSHPPLPSTSSSSSSSSSLSSLNALPPSFHLHRSSSSSVLPLSTAHNHHLRRSCSATFDSPNHHFTPKPNSPHLHLLDPSFLGIRTDPPHWPARDAINRECAARRANSIDIDIPLSLRIIKMKQKFLNLEGKSVVDIGYSIDNPLNNVCCSTLSIIREIQSCAFKSRGIVLNEELDDGIVSKVQREMSSSFVWLFREVFAKTPDLFLHLMLITSTFAFLSIDSGVGHSELGNLRVPTREISEIIEGNDVGLWNSMVDEADRLRGGDLGIDQCLRLFLVDGNDDVDDVKKKKFEVVSPVKVEIQSDDYEEYHRTDLLYQTGLFHDPENTLLLSNYAQFLCLVSRDYDRAEECLKRAIQLDPNDAEIVSQYANFLWIIRKDLWEAEERFQQAMGAEPDNSYHASKYASFLWSTGGDETCYPID